eukprot:Lithocolla_globosa_v1_NODE_256_length_4785_cov_62.877137.p3 type:complete len:120 gc:universal NODE_256_length_4785_cov_62.877137:522-881(+)
MDFQHADLKFKVRRQNTFFSWFIATLKAPYNLPSVALGGMQHSSTTTDSNKHKSEDHVSSRSTTARVTLRFPQKTTINFVKSGCVAYLKNFCIGGPLKANQRRFFKTFVVKTHRCAPGL